MGARPARVLAIRRRSTRELTPVVPAVTQARADKRFGREISNFQPEQQSKNRSDKRTHHRAESERPWRAAEDARDAKSRHEPNGCTDLNIPVELIVRNHVLKLHVMIDCVMTRIERSISKHQCVQGDTTRADAGAMKIRGATQ